MSGSHLWLSVIPAIVVAFGTEPIILAAQTPATQAPFRVDGQVVRGTRSGQLPVPNAWVVLHRVGSDSAGPLDSARTSPTGRYSLRYRPFGDSSAVYFVSTSHDGIAYFAPLRGPRVSGEDATITVFDTTSAAIPIKVGGRHVIVGAPQANGRRPIGEVFDLLNDTTVTLVARDSTPLWTTELPGGAQRFQLNASADIAPAAVTWRGKMVGLFAPLSPGLRQFAFTYELPRDAFPMAVRVDRPTGVLEVLVQEPLATVKGARLEEVAPVTSEGRSFRRFMAKDVPGDASFRVDVPTLVGEDRMRIIFAVGATVAVAMMIALILAMRRRAPYVQVVSPVPIVSPRPSEALLQAIAALDTEFERAPERSDDARAEYEARRAVLKSQLADVLAAEGRRA